jgi:hypothetical protein
MEGRDVCCDIPAAPPAFAQEPPLEDGCPAEYVSRAPDIQQQPDGTVLVTADVPDGMNTELHLRVAMAGLSTSWIQGPYTSTEGSLYATIDLPSEAFLHPFAEDYLSSLRVRMYSVDEGGLKHEFQDSAVRMLAWPDGPAGMPAVWDRETAAIRAPNGVVSDALRASLDLEPDDFVVPPLSFGSPRVEE